MSIETQPSKKKRNKPLIFALIGAGALVASIGGVFATNSITINSNNGIEFGQGLSATSTCDADLTTSVTQAYNAADDKFYADTVVVSGIKDYTCNGKTLHVSLVDASGTVCSVDGTHTSGANQDAFTIVDGGTTNSDDDITETVTISPNCDATTIAKVAITTS
jgi:hypothetical protein